MRPAQLRLFNPLRNLQPPITSGRARGVVSLAAALLWPAVFSASAAPLPELEVAPRIGATLPLEAALHDESGAAVSLGKALGGRPAVLVFEYLSCPNLCGVVLGDLAAALAEQPLRAGEDFNVIAVSIDPRDTPADSARIKARLGVSGGWRFLTGADEETRRIADAAGFPYARDETLAQFAHPAAAIVLAPGGSVSSYLLGAGYDGAALRTALQQAAARGGGGWSGLRVLCFGGLASTGRWSATVVNLVRIVAATMVLGLVALMWWARQRRTEGEADDV